ncbi:HAD family phosphatase [Streptomyces adustus]|uniref:HAD family phosphatase n=1 Tax=Streptomyces adustus TaxID=1609272 RepID=A0A5N8V9D2_9ACTN|nr:HAD family phosphatase [Streptomyces adustus]MPY31843.1 HAD family phosphatase [Streptomyces adustus]
MRATGPNPSFDAVVFDLDGTLIDSVRPDFLACTALFEEFGAAFVPEFWAEHVCGNAEGYPALFEVLRERAGTGRTDAELQDRLRAHWERFFTPDHVVLMPGVFPLLDGLRAAGKPLAVASSSAREWVERWLGHFGLTDRFAVVVSGDEVTRRKPDPMAHLRAAGRLGVPARRCVAVEDSPTGTAAARAAGCTVVAVPTALTRHLSHPWADHVVADLFEARQLLTDSVVRRAVPGGPVLPLPSP